MIVASIVGAALVVAQGAVVWGFLRFVKSFGSYTESQRELTTALLSVHESNRAVHESNKRILDQLAEMHRTALIKGAA